MRPWTGPIRRIWYAMKAVKVPSVIAPSITRDPPYRNTTAVLAESRIPGRPPAR